MNYRSKVKKASLQNTSGLERMLQKCNSPAKWEELTYPQTVVASLKEFCYQAKQRTQSNASGKSLVALLTGPPEVEKSKAAMVMANELCRDIYRIELSAVVSKYIGETEKNLEKVFSAADIMNAILFFDEADALFGKRSDVQDTQNRYANMDVSYLLQRIEDYDGIVILSSNQSDQLDEAFMRRLSRVISFPLPSADVADTTLHKSSSGWWYLGVQAGLFALLAFGPRMLHGMSEWNPPFALIASVGGTVLLVSGFIFAIAGVIHLGRNLTPLPVPKNSATLIVTGAYRIVRHPIYSGIICMAFGWGLWVNSWLTTGYALLLFIFFDVKARYEERLLEEKFPEYSAYRERVKRLLPFIY